MNFLILQNLDLLSVGIVVAATVVLGFSIYYSNSASITNKTFLWFALITAIWGMVNYFSYQSESQKLTLLLFKLIMFFATFQAFSLFLFFTVFPQDKYKFSKTIKYFITPLVVLTSIITLTRFLFPGIEGEVKIGKVATVSKGPGLILFGVVTIGLVIIGIYTLIRKMRKTDITQRKSYKIIMIGATITFSLIIIFNFIAAIVFVNTRFIPFGALFFFPFIALTSYAILRHKLFNVRAIWAGTLIFLMAIVAFSEIILAQELNSIFYRGMVFILILLFGIILIQNIIRQEKQREEITELADRLKNVNNILAHDIKGTLSKGRGMMSILLDGLYGPLPKKAKPLIKSVMNDWGKMLDTIINILAASRTMTLILEQFNLKDAVLEEVKNITKDAKIKHLTIKTIIPNIPAPNYTITADKTQLTTHILKNLIENAVNYNLENGTITIGLSRKNQNTFLFTIKDTGIGIKEEDRPNMFKDGGRSKDSTKINVHSTGYGLVAAKKTVEAHGGKIWFESEGISGKGTTFFVELPVLAISHK